MRVNGPDIICGEDGDFYAIEGWHSARALLDDVLANVDWYSNLRELVGDFTTPMSELRKQWTAHTTRGWMRPAGPDDEADEGWWFVCEPGTSGARAWTYWQG